MSSESAVHQRSILPRFWISTQPTQADGAIAQRVLEKLRTLPGITRATYSDNGLFAGRESGTHIRVAGFTPAGPKDSMVRFDQVGPGYFSAVGIPILLGRDFTDADNATAPRVTVINESMAKFYFGKRSPLGATVFYDSRLKFTLWPGRPYDRVVQSVKNRITRPDEGRDPNPDRPD